MKRRLVLYALTLVLLAGLANLPFPTLTTLAQGDDINAVIDAAIAYLGQQLGSPVDPTQVTHWTWEETVWPDASLGCPQPGQVYAQVSTRGYIVQLQYIGTIYEIHLTPAGDVATLCGSAAATTPTPSSTELPPADDPERLVALGKDYINQQVRMPLHFIRWTWQEMVWPDDSLGCPYPDLPIDDSFPQRGYVVNLETADATYELHITASGSRIMSCAAGVALLPMIDGHLVNPAATATPPAATVAQPTATPSAALPAAAPVTPLIYTGPDGNVYLARLESFPGQALTGDAADIAPPTASLPTLNHQYGYYRWSPDGTQVAFIDNQPPCRLLITDAAGAAPLVLAEGLTPLYPPAWNPTADEIAYVTPTQTFRGSGQVMALYAIAPPSNGVAPEPRLIGTFEQTVGCGGSSPDPAETVYTREAGFSGNGLFLQWLPDGSFLLSNSCLGVGLSRLEPSTGEVTVVEPQLARVSLDPLQHRAAGIVFDSPQSRQLVLVDLTGGGRENVPLPDATPDQVHWSADGQRLYVSTADLSERLPWPGGDGSIAVYNVRLWEIDLTTGTNTLRFEQEGRGIGQMVEVVGGGGLLFSFVDSARGWLETVTGGADINAQRQAAPAVWLLHLDGMGQVTRLGLGGQPAVPFLVPAAQG